MAPANPKPKPGNKPGNKPDPLAMDKLTDEAGLAAIAGIPDAWLQVNSEIRKLVEKAIAADALRDPIGQQKFINDFRATETYRQNGAYMADYLRQQDAGGENWRTKKQAAADYVKQVAAEIGATFDDAQAQFFADAALMHNWTDPARKYLLKQAMTGQLSWTDTAGKEFKFETDYLDYTRGSAVTQINDLRKLAMRNGVDFSDSWFESAARSVISNATTIEDWRSDIREMAAGLFPVYSDKIRGGMDVMDLANPYIARMEKVLEMDRNQIGLDNQYIKKALSAMDDKGNPTPMNLWDFERTLRSTPEWSYTKQASDKAGEITSTILRMFTGVG
jgi:hypothetical protein